MSGRVKLRHEYFYFSDQPFDPDQSPDRGLNVVRMYSGHPGRQPTSTASIQHSLRAMGMWTVTIVVGHLSSAVGGVVLVACLTLAASLELEAVSDVPETLIARCAVHAGRDNSAYSHRLASTSIT